MSITDALHNPAPLAAPQRGLASVTVRRVRPDTPLPERVLLDRGDPDLVADGDEALQVDEFLTLWAHSDLLQVCEQGLHAQLAAWGATGHPRPATLVLTGCPPDVTRPLLVRVVGVLRDLEKLRLTFWHALLAPLPLTALDEEQRTVVADYILPAAARRLQFPTKVQRLSEKRFQALVGPLVALADAWALDSLQAVLARLTVAWLANKGPSLLRRLAGLPDDLTAHQKTQLAHERAVVRGENPSLGANRGDK